MCDFLERSMGREENLRNAAVKLGCIFLACCLTLAAGTTRVSAGIVDGLGVELGFGDHASRLLQLNLLWDWSWHGALGAEAELTGYWDVGLGFWRWRKNVVPAGVSQNSLDFSLTPVLRLQRVGSGIRPYLEGGVGVHALTNVKAFAQRVSTSFEFGSHVGAGLSLGSVDLGYRFQHLSNAGIASPNGGVNAHILHLVSHF